MKAELSPYLLKIVEDNNLSELLTLTNDSSLLTTPLRGDIRCLIHWAAAKGRLDLIKIIVEKNPELLNQTDEHNQTPLIWAARYGHDDITQYLISMGADLNTTTNCKNSDNGRTALDWAYWENHQAVIDSLFQAGATVSGQPSTSVLLHSIIYSIFNNAPKATNPNKPDARLETPIESAAQEVAPIVLDTPTQLISPKTPLIIKKLDITEEDRLWARSFS